MTKRIHGFGKVVGLAMLAMLLGSQLQAQTATSDTRWQAWFGCWQPSDVSALSGTKPSGICVSPTNASSAVEVATVQDGVVTARDTIDASGVARSVDKQGCVGTQTGQWSADNRRVFVHSALTCAGGLGRTGNAIIAMTPYGDWMNIQTLTVGKTTGVRAVHYRDANSLNLAPPEIAKAISGRQLAINAARTDAGASLDVPAVQEALVRTDTTAVQSWIVERGTKFNLSARQLVALADAGIPSSVTDVMIGVSYPDHFALKAGAADVGGGGFAKTRRTLATPIARAALRRLPSTHATRARGVATAGATIRCTVSTRPIVASGTATGTRCIARSAIRSATAPATDTAIRILRITAIPRRRSSS